MLEDYQSVAKLCEFLKAFFYCFLHNLNDFKSATLSVEIIRFIKRTRQKQIYRILEITRRTAVKLFILQSLKSYNQYVFDLHAC